MTKERRRSGDWMSRGLSSGIPRPPPFASFFFSLIDSIWGRHDQRGGILSIRWVRQYLTVADPGSRDRGLRTRGSDQVKDEGKDKDKDREGQPEKDPDITSSSCLVVTTATLGRR